MANSAEILGNSMPNNLAEHIRFVCHIYKYLCCRYTNINVYLYYVVKGLVCKTFSVIDPKIGINFA